MHTVTELLSFTIAARREGLTESEVSAIISMLAADPEAGQVIRDTGGMPEGAGRRAWQRQERRLPGNHVLSGVALPLFLITVYSKGRRADLSPAQRNTLKSLTRTLVREYRKGCEGE
jgi:hypothetical protein